MLRINAGGSKKLFMVKSPRVFRQEIETPSVAAQPEVILCIDDCKVSAHSTRTVHQCVMSRVTHEKRSEPFFRTRVCKNPEPPTTAARLSVSPHPAIALGLYVPGI